MFSDKLVYWFSRPVVRTYTGTMLQMDVQMPQPMPKGAKIVAANHPSTTDPFFVASMIGQQSFILINQLLFQVPVLGPYLHRSGHIPVAAGQGAAALDVALEHLRAGHTILIFPEGALSPQEGGFQSPRTGVARLALLSGAPVIPVGIGLDRKRTRTIRSDVRGQVAYGRWYTSGPYNMTVGQPLHFRGDAEDRPYVRHVAETVMHHIVELAHDSQSRLNQSPSLHSALEAF